MPKKKQEVIGFRVLERIMQPGTYKTQLVVASTDKPFSTLEEAEKFIENKTDKLREETRYEIVEVVRQVAASAEIVIEDVA